MLLMLLLLLPLQLYAVDDELVFDDAQLEEPLKYPDWFVLPSGDLKADLNEALARGKQGMIVYFGQQRCSYCEQFISMDLGLPDVQTYIQKHFDVLPIDIWGIDEIIDTDGEAYTERDLSVKYAVNFTPSLIFYNRDGEKVFRLRGFYPPYQFRAALQYVVGEFYQSETFRDYLARAQPGIFFQEAGLTERDFFMPSPLDLSRQDAATDKPLAVFFEQGNCHACDLLHSGPLNDESLLKEIEKMDVAQINIASEDQVLTPAGRTISAREWARQLGIFHLPSILFFDKNGTEVMRVDSIVQFYRLWGVLDYINRRGYQQTDDYQLWRLKQRDLSQK